MTKAELQKRLDAAESELKGILGVCRRSAADTIQPYNEDSKKRGYGELYHIENAYPLKVGEIESRAIWAIAAIRGISPLSDEWEAL